jgi:DNA processing protein
MTPVLSPNTQAILLLTAPLIAGRGTASSDLLSLGEYKRLARHLREIQRQPADLLSPDAAEILRACQPVIDESRLQKLLGRGFLLSQVIERWQARAIWVVSRADAEYPRRLKARLREDAPAVLYGCGDMTLLETGGLAVVGSRHVDDSLIDYTMAVGQLAARAGITLLSGGAKGIDQAAMRGAFEGGGKVCGVLADSLEKTTMNREHRNLLLDRQLVLISPYDPGAGFNVGNAMQRNKLIYALSDASLVVHSDINKGGTWAGAVEQLDKLKFVPVFIRSTGKISGGLEALKNKGALPWPNPQDVDSFKKVCNASLPKSLSPPQTSFPLFDDHTAVGRSFMTSHSNFQVPLQNENQLFVPMDFYLDIQKSGVKDSNNTLSSTPQAINHSQSDIPIAKMLFSAVQTCIQKILTEPMKDTDIAQALNVSKAQAKEWLERLVNEGVLNKEKKKAVFYMIKQIQLFDSEHH